MQLESAVVIASSDARQARGPAIIPPSGRGPHRARSHPGQRRPDVGRACAAASACASRGGASSSSSGSRRPTTLTRPPPRLRATSTIESSGSVGADRRRVVEMDVEIIGQRQRLPRRSARRRRRSPARSPSVVSPGHDEVAEQMRIGRGSRAACRRRSGRAPRPFPAAPADRRSRRRATGSASSGVRMRSSRITSVGFDQDGISPRRRYRLFGAHRIADQLLFELAGQVELDAARAAVGARQRDVQLARRRRPASSPAAAAR